jgi:hypothetical protein
MEFAIYMHDIGKVEVKIFIVPQIWFCTFNTFMGYKSKLYVIAQHLN